MVEAKVKQELEKKQNGANDEYQKSTSNSDSINDEI